MKEEENNIVQDAINEMRSSAGCAETRAANLQDSIRLLEYLRRKGFSSKRIGDILYVSYEHILPLLQRLYNEEYKTSPNNYGVIK